MPVGAWKGYSSDANPTRIAVPMRNRPEIEPTVHEEVAPDVAVGGKDEVTGHPEVPIEDRSPLGEKDVAGPFQSCRTHASGIFAF